MGKALVVFVILVMVVAIGAFSNYQRNAPLDEELRDRPYASLADKDLNALLGAYEGQVAGLQSQLGNPKADRTGVMDGFAPADFDGKLKAFDRFQRQESRWRNTNRSKLENQIEVEKLQKERGIRDRGLHEERNRILRRVLTF
jgi:hypothetical protein